MLEKFSQGWTLKFSKLNIEQNYREECSKLQTKSSALAMLLISCIFILGQKELLYYHAFSLILPFFPSGYLKILALESCCLCFIIENFDKGSLLELTFLYFPSFLTQFYIIKRWEVFLFLACIKSMLVPCEKKSIELVIIVLGYTFLAMLLEKNLRNTWKTIKKHKESHHTYKELWMKIPFPVFIVNQKFNIVFSNTSFQVVFGKACKFEDIFKDDNFHLVTGLLKKVFKGNDYEETLIKEKGEEWLFIIRIVEWKYERCVEISIIEILETAYSERIFKSHYFIQDKILTELNELIVDCFQEKRQACPKFLEKIYAFCINLWSFQIYIEQQAEYSISNDVKCVDFQVEVINTIDIFNAKNTENQASYKFHCNPEKYYVMVNENKLKLFLHVIVDYTKRTANVGDLVDISLVSFESRNNAVNYLLTVKYLANDVTEFDVVNIFKKCREDLKDFENFNEQYSMPYALFYANCHSLGIEVKEASVIQGRVNLSFLLKFKTSILKPVTIPIKVSETYSPSPTTLIWQSISQYKRIVSKSFSTTTQAPLSILPQIDPQSPTSNPNIRRKSSKSNPSPLPTYPLPYATIKRFLYKDTKSKLNFESGVFKVLIVDDIKQNRSTLAQLLKKIMPISHDEASDGLIALELYRNYAKIGFKYQIIFMDLIMPKMTGYEASSRIRKQEREENLPLTYICAVTGNLDDSDKCINSEMNEIGNK